MPFKRGNGHQDTFLNTEFALDEIISVLKQLRGILPRTRQHHNLNNIMPVGRIRKFVNPFEIGDVPERPFRKGQVMFLNVLQLCGHILG